MGTPAPLLSVYGEDEFRLFDRLVRKHARLDFDAMALEWCDEVNGVTIFPKLPVYLRMHHTVWQRNERARQAVETAAAGEVELARISAETLQQLMPAAAQAAAAGTVSPAVVGPMAAAPTAAAPAATAAAGGARSEGGLLSFLPFGQHPPLQPAASPTASGHPSIVGGLWLGDVQRPTSEAPRRRGPQKGPRKAPKEQPRATPRCMTCVAKQRTDDQARMCDGRWPNSRSHCPCCLLLILPRSPPSPLLPPLPLSLFFSLPLSFKISLPFIIPPPAQNISPQSADRDFFPI